MAERHDNTDDEQTEKVHVHAVDDGAESPDVWVTESFRGDRETVRVEWTLSRENAQLALVTAKTVRNLDGDISRSRPAVTYEIPVEHIQAIQTDVGIALAGSDVETVEYRTVDGDQIGEVA